MDALWAVSEVAETYGRIGQHERARELFRFNLTGNPNLDATIWSLRAFIRESIALKDAAPGGGPWRQGTCSGRLHPRR